MNTHDCHPTLNDEQVIDFCTKGFLMLEGIVPDNINRMTIEYLDEHPTGQPTEILKESSWFLNNVILNPTVTGVVRSLLGKNFSLPNMIGNHRVECPQPAQEWHTDGGSKYPPELNYLQVFYYPQACSKSMGPTELLPGSHFLSSPQLSLAHYGRIRGSYHAVAPAGSIFITIYSIWHRRSESTETVIRNNMKYNYWRTSPPKRDWIINDGFDLATADFSLKSAYTDANQRPESYTFRDQFRDCRDAAEMYAWLCGKIDSFKVMGGQGWPLPPHNWLGGPFGVPKSLL